MVVYRRAGEKNSRETNTQIHAFTRLFSLCVCFFFFFKVVVGVILPFLLTEIKTNWRNNNNNKNLCMSNSPAFLLSSTLSKMCRYQRNIPLLYIYNEHVPFDRDWYYCCTDFSLSFHFGFCLISLSNNSTWTVRCLFFFFFFFYISPHRYISLFVWIRMNICIGVMTNKKYMQCMSFAWTFSLFFLKFHKRRRNTHSSSRIACITSIHNK